MIGFMKGTSKDILYVMLVARGRVVTLVRPKKHSVHPAGEDFSCRFYYRVYANI